MTALPSYIDPETWSAFISQRKAMKIPFTPQAQKLVITKLMRMHSEGYDANAALEKAAIYGYRSVFADEKQRIAKPAETVDPALAKIAADRKNAQPMPESIRAQLKQLRISA